MLCLTLPIYSFMPDQIFYDNHSDEFASLLSDPHRRSISLRWLDSSNLDTYRHLRIKEKFIPLFQPDYSLLTIGDGRYGSDAIYFKDYCGTVHASDLNVELLNSAKSNGLLDNISMQNAEDLSFDSDSFDVLFAKEALHHCPRPFMALYEAFRVAKFAVAFVEPFDQSTSFLFKTRLFLKKMLKFGNRSGYNFEKVGNFVYTFAPADFEKFMLGMHSRYLAFSGINDYYHPSLVHCFKNGTNPSSLIGRLRFNFYLNLTRVLVFLRLQRPSLLGVILFKERPGSSLVSMLRSKGWVVKELPSNPYLG